MVQIKKAEKPWIESREFFGLVILIAVIGINYAYMKRLQKFGNYKFEKGLKTCMSKLKSPGELTYHQRFSAAQRVELWWQV
ncbi:hypothetical protein A0256_09800 [Mucilaginibacter sp. PAMC 26640]|nr:hypothetical protein A0256_09800 [Mucilaginibacter sp. PAMC 26640]